MPSWRILCWVGKYINSGHSSEIDILFCCWVWWIKSWRLPFYQDGESGHETNSILTLASLPLFPQFRWLTVLYNIANENLYMFFLLENTESSFYKIKKYSKYKFFCLWLVGNKLEAELTHKVDRGVNARHSSARMDQFFSLAFDLLNN